MSPSMPAVDNDFAHYVPAPFPVKKAKLPKRVMDLAETLAKNTHEVWAKGRRQEGWTYGPSRDDAAKKHPGLIPYEALSEAEKDYDRNTSLETLRLIRALGYTIVCPLFHRAGVRKTDKYKNGAV